MTTTVLRTAAAPIALLAAAILVGCGGGGSDDSSMSSANSALPITSSNAAATAAEVITMNQRLSASATTPSAADVATGSSAPGRAHAAAAGSSTNACTGGGSFTTVSTGTGSATVTFANCADTAFLTINGSQTYANLALSSTSTSVSLGANISNALTVNLGTIGFVESGNYAFDFTANFIPLVGVTTETFDLTGTRLSIGVSSNGVAIDSVTLSNFAFNYEQDLTVSPNELYGSGSFTVASTLLNGSVVVTTTQQFKQINDPQEAHAYPYTGQALMVGGGGTRLLMTVFGDETYVPSAGQGQVELQVDTGSGGFGAPIWVNWVTLAPAAAVPRHAVGGTVTGLAGGGTLVLLDNASDPLTVSANGSFTFLTALPAGTAYGATVGTQPILQTCAVANGSGTVGTAAVSNIVVTCTP